MRSVLVNFSTICLMLLMLEHVNDNSSFRGFEQKDLKFSGVYDAKF